MDFFEQRSVTNKKGQKVKQRLLFQDIFRYSNFADEENKIYSNCLAYDYRDNLNFPWLNLMVRSFNAIIQFLLQRSILNWRNVEFLHFF